MACCGRVQPSNLPFVQSSLESPHEGSKLFNVQGNKSHAISHSSSHHKKNILD
jgi:hypothetical protein